DRIQQAAYALIPQDKKQQTHYKIGKLLLTSIPEIEKEERIFDRVNQLNYGVELIIEQKEKDELSKLNLIACKKARAATAYQASREYANIGLSLLRKERWKRQYEITLEFHDLAAELASLCGDFEAMEKLIDIIIAQTHTVLEQANAYRIKIQSHASKNHLNEAMTVGLKFLQQLGIIFPKTVTPDDIHNSILEIEKPTKNLKIEDLINLPRMTDREKIATVQIANSIMAPASISGSPFFPLLVTLSVRFSIQYGNTLASAMAYACYGIIACNMNQNVEIGVKFGNLALRVASQLNAQTVKPEVSVAVGLFILHRKAHIKETLPLLQEGYTTALEVGNLEFAGRNIYVFCLNSFWCGQPLITLEKETHTYCNELLQLNQLTAVNYCRIFWQAILNLLGFTEYPSILSGEVLQQASFQIQLTEAHDLFGLYFFYLCKLMLCYLFEEIEPAQNHAIEIRRYLIPAAGTVGEPAFYFYDSLTALATLNLSSSDTLEIFQQVEENQTKLQQYWANYAPMNYQHKVDLVEAEKCRVLGKKLEAMELYDKAIAGAKEQVYIQEEALANELAVKFYLNLGREKIAQTYIIEAYYCYSHWGAKAKTQDLEQRYPQLLAPIFEQQKISLNPFKTIASLGNTNSHTQATISSNTTGISDALDFTSVMKASLALSSEIELNQLISQLMQVMIENAGATKGVLMLSQ
ncbi:MAG: serine/threonine protein kinase, partial [Microcoleaceae cyanobacterium]